MDNVVTKGKGIWNGSIARQAAVRRARPIVTPVGSGLWVMYPPRAGEPPRGGYLARTPEDALAATAPIAERVWGVSPIIVRRQLANVGVPRKESTRSEQ